MGGCMLLLRWPGEVSCQLLVGRLDPPTTPPARHNNRQSQYSADAEHVCMYACVVPAAQRRFAKHACHATPSPPPSTPTHTSKQATRHLAKPTQLTFPSAARPVGRTLGKTRDRHLLGWWYRGRYHCRVTEGNRRRWALTAVARPSEARSKQRK